jgi:transposase-like protein
VEAVWPQAIVQTCIIHLIRNTFRLTSRADSDAIKRDIRPIYTAPNADAALTALDELEEKWGAKYRAMIRLWRNAWTEFIPFLDYDIEIRRVICSTNAIESLNARYRRAVRARGHFPTEQAGRIQPIKATPGCCSERSCSSKTSAGVRQPRTLRGRLFIARATASRSSEDQRDRSVPFGKY